VVEGQTTSLLLIHHHRPKAQSRLKQRLPPKRKPPTTAKQKKQVTTTNNINNNNHLTNNNHKENIEQRKLKFASTLEPFLENYGREMLNEFYKYWTEPNNSNTKFRKELQKTWSVERRLETWSKNENNFKKEKSSAQKEKEKPLIGRMTQESVEKTFNAFLNTSANG
jgi:hypothetical protein